MHPVNFLKYESIFLLAYIYNLISYSIKFKEIMKNFLNNKHLYQIVTRGI